MAKLWLTYAWKCDDLPGTLALRNVCCRGNSGKHLLAASISPFDP